MSLLKYLKLKTVALEICSSIYVITFKFNSFFLFPILTVYYFLLLLLLLLLLSETYFRELLSIIDHESLWKRLVSSAKLLGADGWRMNTRAVREVRGIWS